MRYPGFAAILVALQFVSSTGGREEIILGIEETYLDLTGSYPNRNLQNCSLVTNTEKSYSVYPKNESPASYVGYESSCSVRISGVAASLAGLWNLTTISDGKKFTEEFKVLIQSEPPVRPATKIVSVPGQWIKVGLNGNETDVRFCNVTTPTGLKVNLMTEKIEGASLWGQCGIRMLMNGSFRGEWQLLEQIGEYRRNRARFQIGFDRRNSDSIAGESEMQYVWDIGSMRDIVIDDPAIIFCQLTSPEGTKMPVTFKKCKHTISVVNVHHEGTWWASYARRGKIELERIKIVVKTRDPEYIKCSYFPGADGEINVLCKTGRRLVEFCTFIRPDNQLLHLPPGVGNDNYSYYGIGYDEYSPYRDHAECGVTIHKPSDADFGIWTCEMGIAGKIYGSVIHVAQARAGEYARKYIIDQPPVFVRRNDSFKLACKADEKLNYCWFTSPNGTTYSVSRTSGSDNNLMYEGKGFHMGECGATVTGTDSGDWICHLGIDGGFEIEGIISVTVTDTYLTAKNSTVYVADTTNLTCRTIVGDRDSINYCRWVRPNGHGVNKADARRYRLTQGIDECSLTILDLEPSDVGKWMCFASLVGTSGSEQWATVYVLPTAKYEFRTAMSFSLGTGLLITMLIAATWVALFIYRRKIDRVIKDPPPYYSQDYVISADTHTNAEPIPNKNYRY